MGGGILASAFWQWTLGLKTTTCLVCGGMGLLGDRQGLLTVVPAGSRELLQRVAASHQFEKSKRLRDLLLYLGERGLQDPGCVLHEQEIGVDVFGRQPDYDTSHDTLVRVQISQLRKKLQEYFQTEGRGEPLIIDIPKGSYVPVFRPPADSPAESEPEKPMASRARPFLAGMAAALALFAAGWGIFAIAKHSPGRAGHVVDAFWSQLFHNGHATYIVLSDVTLIEFQNMMGRSIPLAEYETHEFEQLAGLHIADPMQRTLAKQFVSRVTTSLSDVQVARDFSLVAARNEIKPLSILSARDVSSSLIASENTILVGSWRANPWVGLFEDRMAFQTDYQETPPAMRFVNRSPRSGEPAAFEAEWRRNGYCRVTYMPNPNHTGNVLLITGSDVISAEAGGRYVTSEESLGELRAKLGLKPGDPIPHFEILLRTQVVNNTVPYFEMIAYRPHAD